MAFERVVVEECLAAALGVASAIKVKANSELIVESHYSGGLCGCLIRCIIQTPPHLND
jgi:hypothetical protein